MAWWVPYALIAAGTAGKYYGEKRTTDRQNRLADAMTNYRLGKSSESRAAIDKYLEKETPQARGEENTAVQSELAKAFASADPGTFETPEAFAGRVSPDYTASRAAGKARTDERLRRSIDQLSRIGTPGRRALAESSRYGSAATDVDLANRSSANVSSAYANAINTARPDPFLSFASDLMLGLGLAGAGGAAGAAAGAGATKLPTTRVTAPSPNYGLA